MPILVIRGFPGVGKTTLIRRIREWVPPARSAGFYTVERRDSTGRRVGFDLIDWRSGREYPLARVDWADAPYRVGKYGVRTDGLDTWVRAATAGTSPPPALWVIDELGKMERFSAEFITWLHTLDLTHAVAVCTAPVRILPVYRPFFRKWHPEFWTLTRANRAALADRLRTWIARHLASHPVTGTSL